MNPTHFAEPARRTLTAAALAGFAAEGETPKCRACGKPLVVGDKIDPFWPYDTTGNLHLRCVESAPAPRRSR